MKVLFLVLLGLYGLAEVRCEDDHFEDGVYKEAIAFVMECSSQDVGLCLKERALKYIDRLPANMDIGGAIKIKQLDAERSGKHFNPLVLPEEPRAREEAVDNALFDKIAEYLSSHTVEFRLPSESVKDMQRSMMVDEGRKKQGGGGGGKKGGGGMKMMMMLGMKGALLGALALKFIALIAFKALVIAKIAFTISAIIALKKLLGGKQQSSTYEVVAHPHYEEHGGGHYDRSFGPELAYRGHVDPKNSHISY
ncbi:uncharacterized protein LOC123680350 [Harmonia axyridis]|uniref:uncharacterized protein LOC123680350 n=1 Tax=Harmonia axyridis TaxID=115357 RepID=UPI001E276EE3|nr:uncharacterized protein LOC123680350 [Harmonia axyridis]